MSEKIASNIFSAVDILLDKKLQEAHFDRTIQATIVKCVNPSIGQYAVLYQDAELTAFGDLDMQYERGDRVYINVPENDFSRDKTILGRIDKYTPILPEYAIDEANYNRLGTNIFTLRKKYGKDMVLYDAEANINELELSPASIDHFLFYLAQSDALLIYPAFISIIGAQRDANELAKINFGIKVKLAFSTDDNQIEIKTVIFDIDYILGNPYNLQENQQHFGAFTDYDFTKVTQLLSIEYFTEGVAPEAVTLCDLRMMGGVAVQKTVGKSYAFIEKENNRDSIKNSDDTITCTGKFVFKGSLFNNKKGFESLAEEDRLICHWFKENPMITRLSPNYSTLAGEGWEHLKTEELMTDSSITFKATDILTNFVDIKFVVQYNKQKYSSISRIYNEMETYIIDVELLDDNLAIPVLECNVSKGGIVVFEDLTYSWSFIDNSGFSKSLKTNGSQYMIEEFASIIKEGVFKCGVELNGKYIGAGERKFKNTNADTLAGYTLRIANGNQTFLYNENGELLTAPLELIAELYAPDGSRVSGELFTTNWQFAGGYTITENTAIGDTCTFNVANEYSFDAGPNGAIVVSVTYLGKILTASTSFSFLRIGQPGTNGTEYTCQIQEKNTQKSIDHCVLTVGEIKEFDTVIKKVGYPNALSGVTTTWYLIRNGKEEKLEKGELILSKFELASWILKAKVILEAEKDLVFYAYLPIVLRTEYAPDLEEGSGFYNVIYSSSGKNPSYIKNNAFKIKNINAAADPGNQGWEVHGENLRAGEQSIDSFMVTMKDTSINLNNNYITYGNSLIIPIHCMLNRYENATLNDWDGREIQVTENNDILLSPLAGFGTKNENNTFTGVMLGKIVSYTDVFPKSSEGIFGYKEGIETFRLDTEGNASFSGTVIGSKIIGKSTIAIGELPNEQYNFQVNDQGEVSIKKGSISLGEYWYTNSKGELVSEPNFSVSSDGSFTCNNGVFRGAIEGSTIFIGPRPQTSDPGGSSEGPANDPYFSVNDRGEIYTSAFEVDKWGIDIKYCSGFYCYGNLGSIEITNGILEAFSYYGNTALRIENGNLEIGNTTLSESQLQELLKLI